MRYDIIKHPAKEGWYIVIDSEWQLVCEFREHQFNATQNISEMGKLEGNPLAAARVMRELGEWLASNHPDKVF